MNKIDALIEEVNYRFEMLSRWMREQKLRLFGISRAFYCQSEIEGDRKCTNQCEHCKEYYKPLEQSHVTSVGDCSEQWHVLSANMGDGNCSKCGKKLTELNYRDW